MSQKIHKKQYLRYVKTYAYAIRRTRAELMGIISLNRMSDYPVDHRTVEDAITDMEIGTGLRETNISNTDLYAIKEALNYIDNVTRNTTSREAREADQEPILPNDGADVSTDSQVPLEKPKRRNTRNRKSDKDKSDSSNKLLE